MLQKLVWFVLVSFLAVTEAFAEGFLTLPIRERSPVVRNGWYYTTRSPTYKRKHFATDYSTVDGQDIIAACDGVAIAAESWVDANGVGSYGYFTLERCNDLAPDGSRYMAIYAHLERAAPHLASKSRYDVDYATWTRVRRGEVIGYAGKSGTNWPHVHFEVFTGDYANKLNRRVDPYNLYGLASIYPGDGRGTGSTGYLWLAFPPAAPHYTDQDEDGYNMLEDCDDGNAGVNPGAIELCNGRDENCDGVFDDRWAALGTPCVMTPVPGCERSGIWVCSADETTIVCNADTTVGVERCDGLDNDCDGQTDEDWQTGLASDLGRPCEVGRGLCRQSGVFECATPDGLDTTCNAEPGAPGTEYCDGLDNDCDGAADNSCVMEPMWNACCSMGIEDPLVHCVQITTSSMLWADWDPATCDPSLFIGRVPPGGTCRGSSECVWQYFAGICGWYCTSHAAFCLYDRYRSYCTKMCWSDLDCPPPLICQVTNTIRGGTVNLCREVY